MNAITDYPFLDATHPIYDAWRHEWTVNERRLRGGWPVVQRELMPFEWEDVPNRNAEMERLEYEDFEGVSDYVRRAHYDQRKSQAVYVNFPQKAAHALVGALARHAPEPPKLSFGSLGDPLDFGSGPAGPSRANQLYRNANGPGKTAAQWDAWWNGVHERAMATGHRWVLATSPTEAARNRADELAGRRPYLAEFSPLAVPNWQMDDETLYFAVVKRRVHRAEMREGKFFSGYEDESLLLVREGYTALGDEFAGGGWWVFDKDGMVMAEGVAVGEGGELGAAPLHGTFERTGGEIPMGVLYYERDDGTAERPAMSRPGLTEIGQIAVSHMNLGSAGDNDAIKGGGRQLILLGVGQEEQSIVAKQIRAGSRLIGVPPFSDHMGGVVTPTIHDSAATSASAAIETRQERKVKEIAMLAADEAAWAPHNSAVSKEMGFKDLRSPRLALMAQERETAETTMIHLLEQLWSEDPVRPTGMTAWPKDFSLASVTVHVLDVLEVMSRAGVASGTLARVLVKQVLAERGFLDGMSEDQIDDVEREIGESLEGAGVAGLRYLTAGLRGADPGGNGVAHAEGAANGSVPSAGGE